MRNPLRKRIPKEIREDIGKYLVLFLFLTLTIAMVSGCLVAGGSMMRAYDESFEKYNIEYGNFETDKKMDESVKETLEQAGTILYDNFYIQEKTKTKKRNSTLRIFKNREEVNKVCLMKGKLPKSKDEIAIDRMYADNNEVKPGDKIKVGERKLTVSGLVALSDYSALYESNNELMFDALSFGVAVMTEEGFKDFKEDTIHYSYSFLYTKQPKDEIKEKELSDDFLKVLASNVTLETYIPRYMNQAINFTGDDLGGDQAMMVVLLYILIFIIAFIFAITTSNTISKEATVIGTLRASGYTRGELVRHYLAMPVIVTLFGAITGNILGYTVFKNLVANLYYGSYSLTTYKTIWNSEAFIKTTVVPLVLMVVINLVILTRKMRIEPLRFIRNDLSKTNKKSIKLPNFKFMTRFSLRIFFQNIPSYLMLFVGIFFASVILLFGMMMPSLIEYYQNEVVDNMFADYQYVLKTPESTKVEGVEQYAMKSLRRDVEDGEEVTVYGIQEDSKYVKAKIPDKSVYVSTGYAEKYLVGRGDSIKLREKYSDDIYEFKVKGIYNYPSTICIFMNLDEFCSTFDYEAGYFNGYFSEQKISDIPKAAIATTITEEDMTKLSRQLTVSMGNMFQLVNAFAIILYMLIMFLLSKLVIEKNANAISMVKILGYENNEIRRLYMRATSIVVMISLILGTGISVGVIKLIYRPLMSGYSGWLPLHIPSYIYVEMVLLGIVSYLVVQLFLYRKIKKVPMDEALKNVD